MNSYPMREDLYISSKDDQDLSNGVLITRGAFSCLSEVTKVCTLVHAFRYKSREFFCEFHSYVVDQVMHTSAELTRTQHAKG